ncbi:MAG: alpha-L-fucosidase [Bryobacteraceae bacterium]|nr:alpha-L-fucosidase [Bryobacteraceae bacterium]
MRLSLLLFPVLLAAQNLAEVKPAPPQLAWQELEFGAWIHLGPNTFLGQETGDGSADPNVFQPADLDPEQWVLAAKAAGARYLILVAKHEDGFCLWPTRTTAYSVKQSKWQNGRGDVVKETAAAARRHGLKFGLSLSPVDHHELLPRDPKAYDRLYLAQLRELTQNYGDLVEMGIDGADNDGQTYDFDGYLRALRAQQPNAIVSGRLDFLPVGDARVAYTGAAALENWNAVEQASSLRWRPGVVRTPLRDQQWFWHPASDSKLKTVDQLMDAYHKSVGRGYQFLLGLAPDTRGLLPENDVRRLKEFGDALTKLYSQNLAARSHKYQVEGGPTEKAAFDGDPDTAWFGYTGRRTATLSMSFPDAVVFDRIALMEWLNDGQKIQRYRIQSRLGSNWTTIAEGASIGHRRIEQMAITTAQELRFEFTTSSGAPAIREIQIFHGGGDHQVSRLF